MKRKPCQKDQHDNVHMTQSNLFICLKNQQGFQSKELNESLHLQYYGFCEIDNLVPFKHIHTLFLNNNTVEAIQNLEALSSLCTINLSYNRIKQFKGLKHLTDLYSLDLSNNFIEFIEEEEISPLEKLSHFKIAQNKLSSYDSIKAVRSLSQSLTFLDLSGNQNFTFDPLFYTQLLSQMALISILSLQNTTFNRSVASYRKQTINAGKALMFLDDRPVTQDQRLLAKAWKEGGLVLEKELRQKLRQKIQERHDKIYNQMQERARIADQKRKQAYDKLTCWEQAQLSALLEKIEHEDYQLLSQDEKNNIKLQIQDYQRYLQLMKGQMAQVDLQKVLADCKVQVPRMIIDKETPQAIYVYNVSQQQIPLIKQKYYPQDIRQIIAVNYQQQSQTTWIQDYDAILLDCYNQLKGNLDLLVPTFNLSLYDFDENAGRKLRRFEIQQLKAHLTAITKQQQRRQKSIDVLYELD